MTKNNFYSDLEFSQEVSCSNFWIDIYMAAFPGCQICNPDSNDSQIQRLGIDRTIVLKGGKAIYIDEKVRRVDYGDILLEYISNDVYKTKGWVEKTLFCDYVAYAIQNSKKCYFLSTPQMQSAWAVNKKKWIEKFGVISAENHNYNTLSCPVSINDLFVEMYKFFIIKPSNYSVI